MILPDVNILIYAFRKDSQDHWRFREWVESAVNGPSAYAISPQVLGSFVRVVTHPRVFAHPSRVDEALAFCNAVMQQPHCNIIQPGPRHWSIFADLCQRVKASGNLVQDTWFAALAIESGCEWITTDSDYARFTGLSWRRPF
jgi:uncharacterized protein